MKNHLRRLALGACLAATLLPAQAALTVSTTRIVFDSDKRSTSVVIANPSPRPYAVQTWINTSKDDTDTPVPLATSPGCSGWTRVRNRWCRSAACQTRCPKTGKRCFT